MGTIDNLMLIVMRALEVSLTLISPLSVLLYLLLLGSVGYTYRKRPRLGGFLHVMSLFFFFFVIWNHPGYSWYKDNPWNGGYVYAAIIVVVYMYLPLKVLDLGLRVYRRIRGEKPPKEVADI